MTQFLQKCVFFLLNLNKTQSSLPSALCLHLLILLIHGIPQRDSFKYVFPAKFLVYWESNVNSDNERNLILFVSFMNKSRLNIAQDLSLMG